MLTAILCGALGASAHAHHSHFYDECESVAIEGCDVDWVNVTRLTSAGTIGAAKESVVPGARIAVTGYRIRTAAELKKVA